MSLDPLPDPIFLGFSARKPWIPAREWDPEGRTGVVEVCSVSECLAEPPPDWVQRWDFNRAFCHAAPEAAAAAVPLAEHAGYSIFAYWLVPTGNPEASAIIEDAFDSRLPPLPNDPGPDDFEVLGFDVVDVSRGVLGFGCSPLSCNGLAKEERVNRFCLVDERDRALALAAQYSVPGAGHEPGTYHVVRVARQPRIG